MSMGSSNLTEYFLIFTIILLFIYKYFTRNFDYWEKRNVPSLKPKIFIGNIWKSITLKLSLGELLKEFYESIDAPFFGIFIFDEPALVIRDSDIIKHILVQDFNNFQDRIVQAPAHNEIVRNLLFMQKNPEWKSTRSKLTPNFSSAKLRNFFPIITGVCDEMVRYIHSNSSEQDTRNLFHKFSTEVITQTFFGVKGQCFEREDSEIRKQAKALIGFNVRNALIQSMYFFKGHLVDILKLEFFQFGIEDFFRDMFWKCMKNMEGLETKPNNFMSILADLRRSDPTFDGDKLVAQGLMFFSAGSETTSTAISFTLYELCVNPTIQNKVRSEIQGIVEEKGLSYESVKDMVYLELCILEALRKYPPLSFLDRKCTSDYKIPGTDIVIEKGLPVYIPIFGIQNDEKYYPEPEKFIPERYQLNLKTENSVYAAFGSGPRSCVGERFGMLNTKLALVHIISNFSVEKVSGTPSTIQFDPKCFLLFPKGGLPMKFKKLKSRVE